VKMRTGDRSMEAEAKVKHLVEAVLAAVVSHFLRQLRDNSRGNAMHGRWLQGVES
jgi:hypothetical protein